MKFSSIFEKHFFLLFLFFLALRIPILGQVVINEGSNKNYTTIMDEDGDFPDWIEIYNSSTDTISLYNYGLSDDVLNPTKWLFPNIQLLPGEYKSVFCSGKNRRPVSAFNHVLTAESFVATTGWNTHVFSNPFYWDGVSNILINVCSYSNTGYTTNSVFNQSATPYFSTVLNYQDGSPASCMATYGGRVAQRPNIKLNNSIIGTGTIQNSPYDYPAPYGNWYWGAKHQMLISASELSASGLQEGMISSLSFDVASTDPNTIYTYIDFSMKLVAENEVSPEFQALDTLLSLHTNFGISNSGDTIYLFSPNQNLLSSLFVNCTNLDNSVGCLPDASATIAIFDTATPNATNNFSQGFNNYLLPIEFTISSGIYNNPISVSINNSNLNSSIHYTTDGSNPTINSPLYMGQAISIFYSTVLKARAFSDTLLPSPIAVASYLLGINHVTPILSVVTDNSNLYGTSGIFDNWQTDWQKSAYAEYFDENHQIIFSQASAIQMDGGAGGSRSNPQRSFRLELANSVLGDSPVDYPLIPNKSYRNKYSSIYLRNGSNQFLNFPYKDACQTEAMGAETNNYYSGWRPVTVYINGAYFGLYELREKFDEEFFEEAENADKDSMDILSQSAWYGGVLRALRGSSDSFYNDIAAFNALDEYNQNFWEQADNLVDMEWYNDYIIAESWMGNRDWPGNNIKIYRSNTSDFRWRFCLIDLELAMEPYGWTNCFDDPISYLYGQDPNNPYIGIWLKAINNGTFRNYFINRFADIMNTSYKTEKLLEVENSMFNQTVLEMPREYARWGDPNSINQQMSNFNTSHLTFQSQLSQRTEQVRNFILNDFNLQGQVDVTLKVFPPEAGKIKISTIIPDSLPWTGVYFNGNPVRLTAYANPGYEFAFWDTCALFQQIDTNSSLGINITENTVFKAVFNPLNVIGRLSFSELNYNSDSTRNSGNWIEIHNYGTGAIDISGWRFTDGTIFNNYIFSNGTQVGPGERIVLAQDTMLFHSQFPNINVYGPLGFGFSNTSESLSLYDFADELILNMAYTDSFPWPEAADGFGATLELKNDTLNPNDPLSWFAGCVGGSPGMAYTPCLEKLIFSEINYKSSLLADAGDWIELYNKDSLNSMDISGYKFRDGDDTHNFDFPSNTVLPPNGYLVLYNNPTNFNNRFPNLSNTIGPFLFGLSNSGEAIRIFDEQGKLYNSVFYDDVLPWPQGAFGNGYTLELINNNGPYNVGNNWMDGCPEGSPGAAFVEPCLITNTRISKMEFDFSFMPNPASSKITILLNGNQNQEYGFEFYNAMGTLVLRTTLKDPINEIDLSVLTNGIYFVKGSSAKSSFVKKLIIQKE